MDAAAAEFASQLADVPLNPPAWPFISCVSGSWIHPEQAQNIDYWASQLRQPVRFSDGLKPWQACPTWWW